MTTSTVQNDRVIYFIYSSSQFNKRKAIETSLNREYRPGWVIVKGKKKYFTEKRYDNKSLEADAIIIASGPESTMKFKDVEIVG